MYVNQRFLPVTKVTEAKNLENKMFFFFSFGSWLYKLQTKITSLSCLLGKHVAGKLLMAEDWGNERTEGDRGPTIIPKHRCSQQYTFLIANFLSASVRDSVLKHHCKQGETADPLMGGASLEHNCSVQPKQEQMTRQKVTEVLWETGTQQKFVEPEALNIINWRQGSEEMAPWV